MSYYELILFLHIVGTSLLLGGAVFNGLLAARANLQEKTMNATGIIGKWMLGALVLLVVTGYLLYSENKDLYSGNAMFQWKMGLVVLGVVLSQGIAMRAIRKAKDGPAKAEAAQKNAIYLKISTLLLFVVVALGIVMV